MTAEPAARPPPGPFIILDPRQALVPFTLYFWWPLVVYFAVQGATLAAIFMVAVAATATVLADGRAGVAGILGEVRRLGRAPVVVALAILLAFFLVTAPLALPEAPVVARAAKLVLTAALGIAVFATVPRYLHDIPAGTAVSGTLGVAAVAIVDGSLGFPLRGLFPVERVGNGAAAFVNFPIVTMAILAFPVAAALAETRQRAMIAGLLVAVLAATIVTKVLTGTFVIVAGALAVAFAALVGARLAAWVIGALVVAYALASPFLMPNLDVLLGPGILDRLRDGYAGERIGIWKAVATEIRQHWLLGQGLDSLQQLGYTYGRERRPLGHAHSMVLHVWAEGGLIGVLCLAGVMIATVRAVARLPGSAAMWGLGWFVAVVTSVSFDFGSLQSWIHVTIILSGVAFAGLAGMPRARRVWAWRPARPRSGPTATA